MPTPVSSTSIRTNGASCRQRKRTQPSRVYLTAFETRFRRICSTSEGSLYTASSQTSISSCRPLSAAMLANSIRSSSNIAATVKSVGSGLMAPDSSLLMSSKALSNRDIAPMACSCCDRASTVGGSVARRRKVPLSNSRVCSGCRKSWLAVARKRLLPSVRPVGQFARGFGRLTCHDQLRLDALALGDIANGRRDKSAAAVFDWTQTDLNRKFATVSPPTEQLQIGAHRTHAQAMEKMIAV